MLIIYFRLFIDQTCHKIKQKETKNFKWMDEEIFLGRSVCPNCIQSTLNKKPLHKYHWLINQWSPPCNICHVSGQALTSTQAQALETLDPSAPWYQRLIVKHRRLVGVAIPFIFFQVIWWSCAIKYNFWSLFPDRYFMSITMVFGSVIAGTDWSSKVIDFVFSREQNIFQCTWICSVYDVYSGFN